MAYNGYILKLEPLNGKIHNTRRVERTLKLIQYLNNEWRSIGDCANHIGVHYKSIHRYYNMLFTLGFAVEKRVWRNIEYRITNVNVYFKSNKI